MCHTACIVSRNITGITKMLVYFSLHLFISFPKYAFKSIMTMGRSQKFRVESFSLGTGHTWEIWQKGALTKEIYPINTGVKCI